MKQTRIKRLALVAIIPALLGLSSVSQAETRKVVIQVSSADKGVQKLAINNAVNVQKALGMDNVVVEVVAYGPGLSILTAKSKQAPRISSLATQGVKFSACGNTIKAVTRKKGKAPVLAKGVNVVPAGVIRIMDLQEQGYSYIKP